MACSQVVLLSVLSVVAPLALAAAPATPADKFLEDVAEVRLATAAIAEQLRSFNALYLGKLETRMVSMAGSLGALHTNVDRLLERAHVWDTLQLHVAAWAEQMHTLSSKMDLLSRAQENMSALESRLSSLPAVDYRLETLSTRIQDADKKLESLTRAVQEAQRDSPLVGQFATRGALATLKVVERKVDRLSQQVQRCKKAQGPSADPARDMVPSAGDDQGGSPGKRTLVVRCQTNPSVVEILRDVSAKVDVIFDHSSSRHEPDVDEDDDQDGQDNDVPRHRHLGRLRRRENATRLHSDHTTPKSFTPAPTTAQTFEGIVSTTAAPSTTATSSFFTFPSVTDSIDLNTAVDWDVVKQQAAAITSTTWTPPTTAPNSTTTPPSTTATPSGSTATSFFTFPPVTDSRDVNMAVDWDVGKRRQNVCDEEVARALTSLTEAVRALAFNKTKDPAMGTTETSLNGNREPTLRKSDERPERPGERPDEPGGCEDLVGLPVPSGLYAFQGHTVYCDMDSDGGGWTVIQRRGDWGEPRLNFSRSWVDYREGFGSPLKEFWIGNKWLHRLSADRSLTLRVDLWDWEGEHAVAEYSKFAVDTEEELYRLAVGGYSGNATDSMAAHNGHPFSTWDANHDSAPSCCPCATAYAAGWWYFSCFEANLNGEFHTHPEENEHFRGIIWEGWRGDYSLRSTTMMVRAADFKNESSRTKKMDVQIWQSLDP